LLKKITILLIAFLCASAAQATTRFIAQTAGVFTGGSACNGQTAITPATWNSTSEVAGDSSLICGTLIGSGGTTGSSGALLTFGWSGSSGTPITLTFDTGAIIESGAWSTGAINPAGHNFLVINGGTNGEIVALSNGTSGSFTNTVAGGSCVLSASAVSNVTVENINCQNIYVRTSTTDVFDGVGAHATSTCISLWTGSNVTVSGNTCNNTHWAIFFIYGAGATTSTNNVASNNTVSNMDHGVIFGDQSSGSLMAGSNCSNAAHDNDFSAMSTWDDTTGGNNYHHDAIHFWTTVAGSYYACQYNNKFHGNPGNEVSGIFTMEAGATAGSAIFNNVVDMTSAGSCADGAIALFNGDPGTAQNGAGVIIASNTVIPGSGCGIDIAVQENATTTVSDNIGFAVSGVGAYVFQNSPVSAITAADGNSWQTPAGGSPFYCTGVTGGSFASWKSTCGFDAHGQNVSFTLNSDQTIPTSSVLIGSATNLTSLGITALDTGAPQTFGAGGSCGAGCIPRPSTGAWDPGAYPFSSGGSTAGTPSCSPLGSTYNATQSVSCSVTGGAPVMCFTTNGTTPATNGGSGCTTGTLYSGAISITATGTTLEVIAGGTGFVDGTVDSQTYTLTVAAPSFNPVAGTYFGAQSVTISTSTSGATITYTTDGSTPVPGSHGTVYAFPVLVSTSQTLQAVGSLSGFNNSSAGSAAYTINPVLIAPANPAVTMQ
jgi:hypothetical protein